MAQFRRRSSSSGSSSSSQQHSQQEEEALPIPVVCRRATTDLRDVQDVLRSVVSANEV